MKKAIQEEQKNLMETIPALSKNTTDHIFPFPEEPRVESPTGPRKRAEAEELFSLFTADIIKQRTNFTR